MRGDILDLFPYDALRPIRVEYFGDPTAAFEGFKAGEYTFRNENSSKNWATSYNFPGVDKGWVVKEELPNGDVGTAQSFVFNLDDETWADPRVRDHFSERLKALAKASPGSSTRIARALLMAEPPSLDKGEMTDKGSINQRSVLSHRAALVEELYGAAPSPRVLSIKE